MAQAGRGGRRTWPWALFGGLLLLGGLGMIPATFVSVQERQRIAAIPHWPTAPGTVVSSMVDWKPARSHRDYLARIQFSYVVDGVTRSSRNVGFSYNGGEFFGDAAAARALVARFPVGTPVTVHYDPTDPAYAMLFPGDGTAGGPPLVLLGLAGLAEAAIGLACLRVARRRRRAQATWQEASRLGSSVIA